MSTQICAKCSEEVEKWWEEEGEFYCRDCNEQCEGCEDCHLCEEDEEEEEETPEEWFDRKYPNASCHRCEKKVTGETVVECGDGCETWYCADCHKEGTHDCPCCADETEKEKALEKKLVAFIKANDDEFEEEAEVSVRNYIEYVDCWKSSWGGGRATEEENAYHDINGFAESGQKTYVVYDGAEMTLGRVRYEEGAKEEFIRRVKENPFRVYVVRIE